MNDSFHQTIADLLVCYFWPGGKYPKTVVLDPCHPSGSLNTLLVDFGLDVLAAGELDQRVSRTRDSIDKTIREHRLEALVSPVAWIRARARQL